MELRGSERGGADDKTGTVHPFVTIAAVLVGLTNLLSSLLRRT